MEGHSSKINLMLYSYDYKEIIFHQDESKFHFLNLYSFSKLKMAKINLIFNTYRCILLFNFSAGLHTVPMINNSVLTNLSIKVSPHYGDRSISECTIRCTERCVRYNTIRYSAKSHNRFSIPNSLLRYNG